MTPADKIAEVRALTAELREHGNDLHGSPVVKSNSCLKAADAVSALADLAEAQAQEIAKLREALKRIDSASKFFSQPGHSDDTLRYAHESTGHITAAALGDAQ